MVRRRPCWERPEEAQRREPGVCGGQEGRVWGYGRECGWGGHGHVSVHMGRGTQGLKVRGEDMVSPRPTSGCQAAAAEQPGQEGGQRARSPVRPGRASHGSLGKSECSDQHLQLKTEVPGPAAWMPWRGPREARPPTPSSRRYSLHQRRFSHRRSNCPHLPLPAQVPGGGALQPQAWTGPAGVGPG